AYAAILFLRTDLCLTRGNGIVHLKVSLLNHGLLEFILKAQEEVRVDLEVWVRLIMANSQFTSKLQLREALFQNITPMRPMHAMAGGKALKQAKLLSFILSTLIRPGNHWPG